MNFPKKGRWRVIDKMKIVRIPFHFSATKTGSTLFIVPVLGYDVSPYFIWILGTEHIRHINDEPKMASPCYLSNMWLAISICNVSWSDNRKKGNCEWRQVPGPEARWRYWFIIYVKRLPGGRGEAPWKPRDRVGVNTMRVAWVVRAHFYYEIDGQGNAKSRPSSG